MPLFVTILNSDLSDSVWNTRTQSNDLNELKKINEYDPDSTNIYPKNAKDILRGSMVLRSIKGGTASATIVELGSSSFERLQFRIKRTFNKLFS